MSSWDDCQADKNRHKIFPRVIYARKVDVWQRSQKISSLIAFSISLGSLQG